MNKLPKVCRVAGWFDGDNFADEFQCVKGDLRAWFSEKFIKWRFVGEGNTPCANLPSRLDLFFFDAGGMAQSYGRLRVGDRWREVLRFAEEHPNVLVVLRSAMSVRWYFDLLEEGEPSLSEHPANMIYGHWSEGGGWLYEVAAWIGASKHGLPSRSTGKRRSSVPPPPAENGQRRSSK